MDKYEILPPGKHPFDSSRRDIDSIGYALERVQTMLVWIDEHRASFEKFRNTDPSKANKELDFLKNATEQAVLHLQRLTDLILAGYSIDPQKKLPKGLSAEVWSRMVKIFLRQHLS